ncbi:MAG: TIGR03560 family F420-dependent LLM class oxidoreductase [Acidimicrobiales bacterium]
MRFSFWIGAGHDWEEIRRSAVHSEEAGYDGLWFADHFLPPGGEATEPCHEVWSVLAALGVATSTVRLGPLVCGNTYRNPGVLAKQAVTADHISGGRIVLGIGSGWLESEHVAYGIEFGSFTDRFEKLEEALQVLISLRSEALTTFDGERYRFAEAPLAPKPLGPLPILVGGGGERKTLRMVAQYADEWNVWADPTVMAHKISVLDEHGERLGRDPSQIQRSAVALLFLCDTEQQAKEMRDRGIERANLTGTAEQLQEQIAAFAEMGVDELIVPDFNLGDPGRKDEIADRFLAEVAAPCRN